MANKTYPQQPAEWRSAIEDGIGASRVRAQHAYHTGQFPYGQLEDWLRRAFGTGFHPDFVPALLRNIKGLVAWAYGEGDEPHWPGSDDEHPGLA